jgi:hypothetical protein
MFVDFGCQPTSLFCPIRPKLHQDRGLIERLAGKISLPRLTEGGFITALPGKRAHLAHYQALERCAGRLRDVRRQE